MAITIRNCDQEPIHALGLTQGHGALIAFDQAGMTIAASGNAALLLGPVPMLGTRMDNQHFDQAARSAIARALADQGLTLIAQNKINWEAQIKEFSNAASV